MAFTEFDIKTNSALIGLELGLFCRKRASTRLLALQQYFLTLTVSVKTSNWFITLFFKELLHGPFSPRPFPITALYYFTKLHVNRSSPP